MNAKLQVVLAAGGNPTGVVCFPDDSRRADYVAIAKQYMQEDPTIEQFGFLEGTSHFQMSGGEFCGNAARVAAWLISERTGTKQGTFTISGFSGTVHYTVDDNQVRCVFPDYPFEKKMVEVLGVEATLVDLGGIVHVVMPITVEFENDERYYKSAHRQVTELLGLGERPAVGVIWQDLRDGNVAIHPVVWVREINSFFYETSCGSGTLATIIAHNVPELNIFQPSGQPILAELNGTTLAISSSIQRL